MDDIDARILHILSDNANATATEIGAAVNLSIPAVNKRIHKLQQDGTIRRFTVLTREEKVGKPITAFVLLVLQSASHAQIQAAVGIKLDIKVIHPLCGPQEELQAAILERMAKNGPVTNQMKKDVTENVWHNSLVTWIRSFN